MIPISFGKDTASHFAETTLQYQKIRQKLASLKKLLIFRKRTLNNHKLNFKLKLTKLIKFSCLGNQLVLSLVRLEQQD